MYMLCERKLNGWEKLEGGGVNLSLDPKPLRTKFFIKKENMLKTFEEWSEISHTSKDVVTDWVQISVKQYIKLLFKKEKMVSMSGTAKVTTLKDDIKVITL